MNRTLLGSNLKAFQGQNFMVCMKLLKAGFSLIPLRGKVPAIKQPWKTFFVKSEDFSLKAKPSWLESVTGYGIICGHRPWDSESNPPEKVNSRVLVIDIDIGKDKGSGIKWWNDIAPLYFGKLEAVEVEDLAGTSLGEIFLPDSTLCVKTGSGGYHVYFEYDDELMSDIRNGGLKDVSIDIKTTGGYVVAPYSVHTSGQIYSPVIHSDLKISKCPPGLVELIKESRGAPNRPEESQLVTDLANYVEHRAAVTSRSGVTIPRESFLELVHLIHPDRAQEYSSWLIGIWAILDTIKSQGWEVVHGESNRMSREEAQDELIRDLYDEGLEIAHEFSNLCPEKYNPESVDKIWNERWQADVPDARPTLGTLLFWAKTANPNGYQQWRKHWLGRSCERRCYDPRDKYSILDYIDDVEGKTYNSKEEAWDCCLDGLLRCVRRIIDGGQGYLIRANREFTHKIIIRDPRRLYQDVTVKYREISEGRRGSVERIRTMNAFAPLCSPRLMCDRAVFYPLHNEKEECCFRERYGGKTINTFPGLQCQILDEYDEKLISPWRDHLRDVIAAGDQKLFEYLEDWLTFALCHLREKQPALVFVGTEGCGKTIFCDFLVQNVFGTRIAIADNGMDGVCQRFNGSLENCCLLTINEATTIGMVNARGVQGKLRSIVYDSSHMIERKSMERYKVDNFVKVIITSNDHKSIAAQYGNRHFVYLDCSSKFCGEHAYFDTLLKAFNQNTANHWATYYIKRTPHGFDVRDNPHTELEEEQIIGVEGEILAYLKAVKLTDWEFGSSVRSFVVTYHNQGGTPHPFIPKSDLAKDFEAWRLSRKLRDDEYEPDKFHKILAKMFPKAPTRQRRTVHGKSGQPHGYFIDMMGINPDEVNLPVITNSTSHIPSIPQH